jgi:two-component system cell cycle response regulator
MARRPPRRSDSGFLAPLRHAWQRLSLIFHTTTAATPDSRATLEAQLRANEAIWLRFRQIELDMLNADTLADVVGRLVQELPGHFPSVHAVSITWIDPECEFEQELLRADPPSAVRAAWLSLPAPDHDIPPLIPVLGQLTPELQRALFPRQREPLRSVAMVPMRLRGVLVGSLNQGSRDPEHFRPDVATDLIEHLAAVTAVCVDNAVNRAHLQRDVLTDALTGVANRRFFERRLQEETDVWRRHGHSLSCLLVDLDHFKQINDRHGHAAGDRALQQVARQLSLGLRSSDVLARYGGEEFVLLLPSTDAVRAREIAERLRMAIARAVTIPGAAPGQSVTVSVGLAWLDASMRAEVPKPPGAWLVSRADEALYRAKARGRNCVEMAHRSGTVQPV